MAATPCDGSYTFWHQGLGVLASGKTGAVVGGDYTYWHQGLGALRLLGAAGPAVVPTFFMGQQEPPIPTRSVVAYW